MLVEERQQRAGCLRRGVGAHSVDEHAARFDVTSGCVQQAQLFARETINGVLLLAPPRIRVATQDAEGGARRVNEHAVGGASELRKLVPAVVETCVDAREAKTLGVLADASQARLGNVARDDDTLVVAPQASGQAVITVTAADPIGATATATFTADVLAPLPDAKISLDLDPADGDQQTLTLTGAPEQAFSVQLFVADVEELMGFTAVFLFDPDALSYDNFTQGPFIPGLVPLAISNADSVEVGGVVLGTGRGTGDGLLGTVNFRTTADFAAQSSVRLALLRLRYTGGREQTLSPGQELQISAETSLVGDFSGDGRVDFSDFFIFADQFGKDVEVGSTFDLNPDGRVDFSDFFVFADQFGKSRGKLIALARELLGLPSAPVLEGNYPNPFNSSTLIPFQLAARSRVRLEIFNLLGQRVRTLVDKVEQPGVHRVAWDGHDDAGRQLTSGLYVYRLLTNGFAAQRRMLLLR